MAGYTQLYAHRCGVPPAGAVTGNAIVKKFSSNGISIQAVIF
jgi:hypothetical protein